MNLSKTVTTTAFILGLIIFIFYYNIFNLLKFSTKRNLVFSGSAISLSNETNDFLIHTRGCTIPNYSKTLKFKEAAYENKTCGNRAIFLEKISHDKVSFKIDKNTMEQYSKGKHNLDCCYRFATRSTESGKEDTEITFSSCNKFENGTIVELKQEVISVSCKLSTNRSDSIVYEDAYIILKKLNESTKLNEKETFNVLLIGMDTMSRARIFSTMPLTIQYLQNQDWLDFKGYQKVGFNTFPNLMSFLTGKKMSTIYKACAKGMENCNQLMIWSKFKDAGYVTAYGEEFLRLPDTFSRYKGFKISPTDHYARPFFLTGETKNGNLICTQKKPSAVQLLDYAVDFVKTYKENFFGMFWLNSFSHNMDNMPALLDSDMVNLFKKINEIGVLSNTFIFFLSDHGIRYGEMRVPLESYYEERLPMLFMWVPSTFRQTNPVEFSNLIINQNRLITPYDVYLSMWEILKLSKNFAEDLFSEACPKCSSLFHEKTYERTCADAGVADKWCSCHNMVKVDQNDVEVEESLKLAISSLQNRTAAIETTLCMTCETLKLKTVLRQHSFESGTNKFYVLAFVMSPGDVAYEALVQKNSEKLKVLEPIDTISAYNTRGNCVKNPNDRAYCVCKKMKKCNKKHKR